MKGTDRSATTRQTKKERTQRNTTKWNSWHKETNTSCASTRRPSHQVWVVNLFLKEEKISSGISSNPLRANCTRAQGRTPRAHRLTEAYFAPIPPHSQGKKEKKKRQQETPARDPILQSPLTDE